MNSREYLAAKHHLADQTIQLPDNGALADAQRYEEQGNWFRASEEYSKVEREMDGKIDRFEAAKLLARSATCFEIAGQYNPAGRVYSDAANALSGIANQRQSAGELFNRSAHCYRRAGAYFAAGSAWMRAATEFEQIGKGNVHSRDNILPVPASAAGLTVAGNCLDAAGDAFLLTEGTQKNWACMAYWRAGDDFFGSFPENSISTYYSYKAALLNGIRQYASLLPERTRTYLPITKEQREAGVDTLEIMEGSFRENARAHYELNGRFRCGGRCGGRHRQRDGIDFQGVCSSARFARPHSGSQSFSKTSKHAH